MDKSRHKSWQILTSVGPGISLLSSNEGFFSSGLFSAEKLVSDSEWGILPARARILVKFIVKGAADPSGWIFSRWFGFRVSDERIKFRTPLSSSSCDLCIGQMREQLVHRCSFAALPNKKLVQQQQPNIGSNKIHCMRMSDEQLDVVSYPITIWFESSSKCGCHVTAKKLL